MSDLLLLFVGGAPAAAAPGTDRVLLEDGASFVLMESGDKILLE